MTSDLRGYLEPCGCTEHMLGGIDRAAAQIATARKTAAGVIYVDAGDSLFKGGEMAPEAIAQGERKAKALAEAYRMMGMNALGVGHRDLARGEGFLTSLGLPLLDGGLGPSGAPRQRIVDAGGVKVAVLAAKALDADLAARAKQSRGEGAEIVVVLLHGTPQEAARQAEAVRGSGIDLVVASHAESEADGEKNTTLAGAVPVIAPMSKGRSLFRADFVMRAGAPPGIQLLESEQDRQAQADLLSQRIDGELAIVRDPSTSAQLKELHSAKILELRHRREQLLEEHPAPPKGHSYLSFRFIELSDEKPSDPAVKQFVEAYEHEVGQLNLAWAREHGRDCAKAAAGKAEIEGGESCDDCHDEAAAVWQKTKHSHAYQALAEKNRQFDLDCVRCHVTGYNQPGGVCRVDKTEGRTGVRCEACHGPGSVHAKDPTKENIIARPGEAACRGCHESENSPNFSFAVYLPQIVGPGHGQPSQTKERHAKPK